MSNLMDTWMRNTSETDYVITFNHVSADEHFDSLVTRVFCPAGQTTPSAYLIEKKNVWGICITLFHLPASLDGWCLH